jgi:aminoglycoside 6'-N-acetyltransferase I
VAVVRQMGEADRALWVDLRGRLWPEYADDHARDVAEMLGSPTVWGFVAEDAGGSVLGFAELAIRPYANGCEARPVPFLEGIWVSPGAQRRGIGRALIDHIAPFVAARGFTEICSDALLGNTESHAAHAGWGFAETERVVYFRKALP